MAELATAVVEPSREEADLYHTYLAKGNWMHLRLLYSASVQLVQAPMVVWYRVLHGDVALRRSSSALTGYLAAEENVDPRYTWYDITSIPAGDDSVAIFWFSARSGCAIIKEIYKARDVGTHRRLPMSELFYQAWSLAAARAGMSVRSMRVIGLDTIVNRETLAAIWIAEKTSLSVRDDILGFRVYSSIDSGFHAILGSPLGMLVGRALESHHQSFGRKVIEKIVVLDRKFADQMRDFTAARDLFFVLRG